LKRKLEQAMKSPAFAKLASHVKFIQTREGLRIDLVDDADYSMFSLGTTQLRPGGERPDRDDRGVGQGHGKPDHDPRPHRQSGLWQPAGDEQLDAVDWPRRATRRRLATGGLGEDRFNRIEASPTASR